MGVKSESITIGPNVFTVTQLTARASQRLLIRLFGLLGPAIGKALGAISTADLGKGMNADIDLAKMGAAIPELFTKLTPDELESIQRALLEGAMVKTASQELPLTPAVWDEVIESPFDGLELTFFALKVNYGNFSEGRVGKAMLQKAASLYGTSGQQQKTGPSGVSS